MGHLQQTQVDRVIPKYLAFLERFPTLQALADASTADVIREWQGLGYNRRALNLKRAAEAAQERGVELPQSVEGLGKLAGSELDDTQPYDVSETSISGGKWKVIPLA